MNWKEFKDDCIGVIVLAGACLVIGALVLYSLFGGGGKPFGG